MADAFGPFKSDDLAGLVDVERLREWLDRQGLATGEPLAVARLSGGMSNESFSVRRGGERWVLRRPAQVALSGADRGMQREFRVLSALEGTPVPHPEPLALCTDGDVIGCAFYLMQHIDGFTALEPTPERFVGDAALQRQVALSMLEALGELAKVDWRGRGLADFGRPEGFHERQVTRWMRQLESYAARELPGVREVGRWLADHQPEAWTPGIMHGDYHTGNLLVAPDPPGRVTAILDWENATIGDPLLDLAGFLRMWEGSDRAGWASREDMIACWERHSGRAAPPLRYYTALSAFRLAVLLEGVYQRSLADPTRQKNEAMGKMVLAIARDAVRAIESS